MFSWTDQWQTWSSQCSKRRLFGGFTVCFMIAMFFLLVNFNYIRLRVTRPLSVQSTSLSGQQLLDCLTHGKWRRIRGGNFTTLENRLNEFFRKTRDFYGLPNPLQRADGMCGNVSFESKGVLKWFRGVCDSFHAAPCCFHGSCRNLPEEQCTCPECHDLRPNLHGEVSEWIGSDKACSLKNFSSNDACAVLRDRTVVFIGDSFMRQMFLGLQILLSNNDEDCCMKATISPEKEKLCKWMFMFIRECRLYVSKVDTLCRGTVIMYLHEYYTPGTLDVIKTVRKHAGSSSALIMFGIGLHYNFKASTVIKDVVAPVLKQIKDIWREHLGNLVWILPHSMGVLKSPMRPEQLNPAVLKFNRHMKEYLTSRHVTVMDAYNLTVNLASYDGSHFTKAANLLKVQVLLNHLSNTVNLGNKQT